MHRAAAAVIEVCAVSTRSTLLSHRMAVWVVRKLSRQPKVASRDEECGERLREQLVDAQPLPKLTESRDARTFHGYNAASLFCCLSPCHI
jgi:hypothetical protein